LAGLLQEGTMFANYNEIDNIRPTSRFDGYKPSTDIQSQALQTMQGLAQNFIHLKDQFAKSSNPFASGAFFVLSGGPGRGKSHLLEALIQDVSEHAPNVKDRMFLLRKSFVSHTITGVGKQTFNDCPIVLIEDLFSDHQSVESLHPATDIKYLSQYIAYAYDNRVVTIATCNFPFMDGILPKIQEVDKVGRISSRCAELITVNSGEFKMDGPDYRMVMAKEALNRRANPSGQNGMVFSISGFPKLEQ